MTIQYTPQNKLSPLLDQKMERVINVPQFALIYLNENGGKLKFLHFLGINWRLSFYLDDNLNFTLLFLQ